MTELGMVPSELKIPISESRYVAEHNTILRAQVGSGLHGINIEGQDDEDEMGVCVEPPDYVLGLRDFEQWVYRTKPEGVRSEPGDLDLTIYGLRKFTRLAAKGNPSILVLLFAPTHACKMKTGLGAELQGIADKFASKIAIRKFLGYMTSQKERLFGERGQMRVHRPELIEKHGYDTKYAGHALRLGYQGVEFAQTGRLTLPVPEPSRSLLRQVRVGEFQLDTIREIYHALENQLENLLFHSSILPQEPDWHGINSWLMSAYLRHWKYNQRVRLALRDWGAMGGD